MVKVAVIFTIVTFLIDQGVEALVIAQWAQVWVLRLALIITVILFPFVMYITWVIINRKKGDEESYEDQLLNIWLACLFHPAACFCYPTAVFVAMEHGEKKAQSTRDPKAQR